VNAQNELVRARIDYTLARLALYRDLGALQIDARGLAIDPQVAEALSGAHP